MAKTEKTETPAKFVAPAKPTKDPGTIDIADYTYPDAKGEPRFWQGWDAKFKAQLMRVSRDPSTNGNTRKKAVKILVERGWSTDEREAAYLQEARERDQRAVDRLKAKAEKANKPKKAAGKKAPAKAETPAEPEVETPEDGGVAIDPTTGEDLEPSDADLAVA